MALAAAVGCATLGSRFLDHYFAALATSVGMQKRVVDVGGAPVVYFDGGRADGPTLVFLHGSTGTKNDFLQVAARFASTHRVVAPDIPPQGESVPASGARFDLASQVGGLGRFLDAADVGRATFVGASMGGSIALALAASNPSRVTGLVAIAPPSLLTEERTAFDGALARGELPFDAPTRETQRTFVATYLFEKPLAIPGFVMNAILDRRAAHSALDIRVFNDFLPSRYIPPEQLAAIRGPVLVMWCDRDRIASVAGARVLQQAIAGAQLAILKGCGHAPHLERPAEVADRLAPFLAANAL